MRKTKIKHNRRKNGPAKQAKEQRVRIDGGVIHGRCSRDNHNTMIE
jgi:hypothetical protein